MNTYSRNNENVLMQQQVMLKRSNVFGVQNSTTTTTTTTSASITTSLHEPKKMPLPTKPRMSRAPLTSIQQNKMHERQTSIEKVSDNSARRQMAASPKKEQLQQVESSTFSRMMIPARKTFQMESPGIDIPHKNDPQQVCEFVKDIVQNNKDNELKYLPEPGYMERQPKISANMRATLVDWLVDVHRKFRLSPETMFLTVNIMDRYLCTRQVTKQNFQLIGVTAMLIACKYEEIDCPEVGDFEKICVQAFTRSDILKTEKHMLAELDFNITVVTAYPFLTRYVKCGKLSKDQEFLCLYFAELCLVDYAFLKFPPSVIACSAVWLANKFFKRSDPWCVNLQYYTGYEAEDLVPCAKEMLNSIRDQRSSTLRLVALRNKYLSPSRKEVAQIALTSAHTIEL